MRKRIFLALAFLSFVYPAQAERDGRWWNKRTTDQKLFYVSGLRDGLGTAAPIAELSGKALADYGENLKKINKADISTLCTGLNVFYNASDNSSIPVYQALVVILMGIHGANERQINAMITSLRKTAAEQE